MKISLLFSNKYQIKELILVSAFQNNKGKVITTTWSAEFTKAFNKTHSAKNFNAKKGDTFITTLPDGTSIFFLGLGKQEELTFEILRREISKIFKQIKNNTHQLSVDLDSFILNNDFTKTVYTIGESIILANYNFNKHKTGKHDEILKEIILQTRADKKLETKAKVELKKAITISESVNLCRDLVNEPPNILTSINFANFIKKDCQQFKRVKIKILNKTQIIKEKMNLLLAVNSGSSLEPRVVHLTYTPNNCTKKTKHVALVGKGLTFDTGGYSLKPATSMVNMKYDMAGAATVYAAFKAAVQSNANIKISCFLGMTDNAIGPTAITPDSIIKARNGKTVEIQNTDAEGRLVLADILDYACDQRPDIIIDSATLTGAILVALGDQMAGIMGNNQPLIDKLLDSAKQSDEYMWQLPIIEEFKEELKSPIADLKNMGNSKFGGSAKAAAFLENFIKHDIAWAHIDIAGIADEQKHLPYCQTKSASGLIVRTLFNYLMNP